MTIRDRFNSGMAWTLGAALAVGLLAGPAFAKPGIVKTRDATYQGEVSEDEEGKVTVAVRGIPMVINRRDVVSIQYVESAEDEFQKRLAGLQPQDVKGRIELARWAYGQQQYDLARRGAEAALAVDPNNREATDLLTMLRRQQEMERNPPPRGNAGNGNGGNGGNGNAGGAPPPAGGTPIGDRKLLSNDDVNLIRQSEVALNEDFRVNFLADVRRKFAEKDQRNLQDFSRLPMSVQARTIIDRAPDMRNDVRLTTDPAALAGFKRQVQPAILQGCATSGCHSGKTGGGFVLFNPAENDQAAYTNFYIITQYTRKEGDNVYSMIDRTTPQKSLLLQFSLPAESAEVRHPDVAGFRGMVRSVADPRFKALSDWLTRSLQAPQPDYGIKYDIPKNTPGAVPATAPSR